jgi:hypothetical protein
VISDSERFLISF